MNPKTEHEAAIEAPAAPLCECNHPNHDGKECGATTFAGHKIGTCRHYRPAPADKACEGDDPLTPQKLDEIRNMKAGDPPIAFTFGMHSPPTPSPADKGLVEAARAFCVDQPHGFEHDLQYYPRVHWLMASSTAKAENEQRVKDLEAATDQLRYYIEECPRDVQPCDCNQCSAFQILAALEKKQ